MVWFSYSAEARGMNVTETFTAIVVELLRITNRAAASAWVQGILGNCLFIAKYIPIDTAANPHRKVFSSKSGMDVSMAWTQIFQVPFRKDCREQGHLYLSPWDHPSSLRGRVFRTPILLEKQGLLDTHPPWEAGFFKHPSSLRYQGF